MPRPSRRGSWFTASRLRRTASRWKPTKMAPSAYAAAASNGSPPRPISTSRNRPSGSSATSSGWASMPNCGGPACGPETSCVSGRRSSNGRRALGEPVTAATRRDSPLRPAWLGGGPRWHIRSDPIAHLAVAEEAREALGLEKILFIRPRCRPTRSTVPSVSRITVSQWWSWRSRTTRPSRPAGSSSTGVGRRTPSTRWSDSQPRR